MTSVVGGFPLLVGPLKWDSAVLIRDPIIFIRQMAFIDSFIDGNMKKFGAKYPSMFIL